MAIFQLRNLVEMVFGPIYAGGILTALALTDVGGEGSPYRGDPRRDASLGRLFLARLWSDC